MPTTSCVEVYGLGDAGCEAPFALSISRSCSFLAPVNPREWHEVAS